MGPPSPGTGEAPHLDGSTPSRSWAPWTQAPPPVVTCQGKSLSQAGVPLLPSCLPPPHSHVSPQKRIYFRIKNEELKSFLSVPDDVEDMKAGRVLVSELSDKISSIWYYEEGLLKNQVRPFSPASVWLAGHC